MGRAEEVAVEFRVTKKELLETAVARHDEALASLAGARR
jgi:hypothetical protein